MVTSFIKKSDYEDADVHKSQASRMGLEEILPTLGVQSVAPLASHNVAIGMDIVFDTEVGPSNTFHT